MENVAKLPVIVNLLFYLEKAILQFHTGLYLEDTGEMLQMLKDFKRRVYLKVQSINIRHFSLAIDIFTQYLYEMPLRLKFKTFSGFELTWINP